MRGPRHSKSAALFLCGPILFGFLALLVPRSGECFDIGDRRAVVAHWLLPMPYIKGQKFADILRSDVMAARQMGVDAFAIDAFNGKQAEGLMSSFTDIITQLGVADFSVFLSADMSLRFSDEDLRGSMLKYARTPVYLKVRGRPLLSTYGGGALGDEWWQAKVLEPLKAAGVDVLFVPYFDRRNPNAEKPAKDIWKGVLATYPHVDGLFNFHLPKAVPFDDKDDQAGHHEWSLLTGYEELANALHESNKVYMAAYMPYYWAVCHSARQYLEYRGGLGMNNMWTSFIQKQKPQLIQLVTWNDYSESTYVEPSLIPMTKVPGIPSTLHLGYYELLKYYIDWYKSGTRPTVTDDAIFVYYLPQPAEVVDHQPPSQCKMGPIPPGQIWGKVENKIYVVVAAKAAGVLEVDSGGAKVTLPVQSGMNFLAVPSKPGEQGFRLQRDGNTAVSGRGIAIDANPAELNLNVYSNVFFSLDVQQDLSALAASGFAGPATFSWFRH